MSSDAFADDDFDLEAYEAQLVQEDPVPPEIRARWAGEDAELEGGAVTPPPSPHRDGLDALQCKRLKLEIGKLEREEAKARELFRPEPIELLSIEKIIRQPDPEWLIEGWLQEGAFVDHYGPSDSGKSFVAISMACAIAGVTNWLHHPTKHGDVVYVYAEGGVGMSKRVRAWCHAHNQCFPGRLRGIPHPINVLNKGTIDALVTKIKAAKLKPVLIVLDTLARCFGEGDENSTKDMNTFVAGCGKLKDKFKCAVLVVHHSGYAGGHSRGSTALKAATDIEIEQKRVGDSKGQLRKLVLTTTKVKNFENSHDKGLFLDVVNVDVPAGDGLVATRSAVLKLGVPPKDNPKENKNEQKILQALALHAEGLKFTELHNAVDIESKDTFRGALDRLKQKGKARKDEETGLYFIHEPEEPE